MNDAGDLAAAVQSVGHPQPDQHREELDAEPGENSGMPATIRSSSAPRRSMRNTSGGCSELERHGLRRPAAEAPRAVLPPPDVLERYQYRFKYILVDEYQDTNRVQYLLLRELARALQEHLRRRRRCAEHLRVPRSGHPEHPGFREGLPACQVFRLEQNYRSTKTILGRRRFPDPAEHGPDPEKTLWTENEEGEPVVVTVCEDDGDEGGWIVRAIRGGSRGTSGT